MKIHSDTLTGLDVLHAADAAGVQLATWDRTGSRSRDHGFEISLRGDSKRRPNFYNGDGSYAATWDQWGVFLGHLFRVDPDAFAGSAKHPTYAGQDDFDLKTADRFADRSADVDYATTPVHWPADAHGDHTFRFAGVPFVQACTKCSATYTWNTAAVSA